MELGPNMKRLREMDVADSVKACVTTGPGDLMRWEVSACLDIDGMELEVIGRGPDLELAAASAMSVLAENGAALEAVPDTDPCRWLAMRLLRPTRATPRSEMRPPGTARPGPRGSRRY